MRQGGCSRDVADLLPWFLNGTLDAGQTERVREHLETCDACLDELDAINAALGVVAPALRPAAPVFRRELSAWTVLAFAAAASVAIVLGVRVVPWRTAPAPWPMAAPGVVLDLGAGPTRGEAKPAVLVLDSATPWVVLSFRPNPGVGGQARVDVVRDGGAAVASDLPLGPIDAFGRSTIVLPEHVLATPGKYVLVVRDGAWPYQYAFSTTRSERSKD